MGMSVLSFIEIFYFCTVRLCCNLRMRRDKQQEKDRKERLLRDPPDINIEKPLDSKDHVN